MSRPRKGTEPLAHRLQVKVTDSELNALDDWMFSSRIIGRSEAIRQLIELGLAASRAGWTPEEPEGEDDAGGDS